MSGKCRGFVRVVVTSIAGVLLFVAIGAADDASAPTGFRVENDRLDLGRVTAGSTVIATFVFRNDSPRDIKILRAAPS